MAERQNRYRQMEKLMSYVLIADLVFFIIYLFAAGFAVIWLKVLSALLVLLISAACLFFLYTTKELLKRRSLWMSVAAAALILCLLFSVVLNFPSPNLYKI